MSRAITRKRLSERWTPLKPHAIQRAFWESAARFIVVPSGRRSGKTEIAKRKLIKIAISEYRWTDARYILAAPTRDQAKRIFWEDLKKLVPREWRRKKDSESELVIYLINGADLLVTGMDKPYRVEGPPLNGALLDEYGNMKESAWTANIRPALADRQGFAWFIGVPEGRNHYYRLAVKAQNPALLNWQYFHWKSADILPPEEIEDARASMDKLTFQQEFEGSFLTFEGNAYYAFVRKEHASETLDYNPMRDLVFYFDFNVAPGVAGIAQEQRYEGTNPMVDKEFTACIGEVWIPKNSTTRRVCNKLLQDWGHHKGRVICYGDATGGAKGSAKVQGSDWDLVRDTLRPHFGEKLIMRVPPSNPPERVRVNALNTRLEAADGTIRLLVDPDKCPHLCLDLEGVTLLEGGSGELDKHADLELTHISDGLGYYISKKYPLVTREFSVTDI